MPLTAGLNNSPCSQGDYKGGHEHDERYRLSESDVFEITDLLWMNSTADVTNPNSDWLANQEIRIQALGESVTRPTACMEDHQYLEVPTVYLCLSHSRLDPRIIGHISLLVTQELTKRTDKFRKWHREMPLPEPLHAWLDRINAATALWLTGDVFNVTFGYESSIQNDGNQCEACILAAVGGRPQLLGDLRASLMNKQSKADGEKPRLLALVNSWIEHYGPDRSRTFQDASDKLANMIHETKKERSKARNSSIERPFRPNKHNNRAAFEPSQPEQVLVREVPPVMECRSDHEGHLTSEVPLRDDTNSMSNQTWDWTGQHTRQSEIGENVTRNIHPAFSAYGPKSAVPAPLVHGTTPSQSSWATMTVHTEEDDQSSSVEEIRPLSQIPESESTETFHQQEESKRYYWDGSEDGEYVPAREGWHGNFAALESCSQPSSSVYSAHSGFRRSARDNASTLCSNSHKQGAHGAKGAVEFVPFSSQGSRPALNGMVGEWRKLERRTKGSIYG